MAVVRDYLVDGVPQSIFDAHTHSYRKVTGIGVDDDNEYLTPDKMDIVDETETVVATVVDARAVGVTVSTQPTSTPS